MGGPLFHCLRDGFHHGSDNVDHCRCSLCVCFHTIEPVVASNVLDCGLEREELEDECGHTEMECLRSRRTEPGLHFIRAGQLNGLDRSSFDLARLFERVDVELVDDHIDVGLRTCLDRSL